MKQLLLTLTALSGLFFSPVLLAQTQLRPVLDWAAEPERFLFEGGQSLERWSFAGAKFDDSAPGLPWYTERFAVDGPGSLDVTVLAADWEPFSKTPGPEDEWLGPEPRFYSLVSKTPDGYYGKVSFIPIIRRDGAYLRARSLTLQVTRRPAPASGRGTPTELSVLREGDIYQVAVSSEGIHRLSYNFLKNELGIANLDNIDPRTIKVYGNGGGILPTYVDAERADDLVENHVYISGEADGRFDSGDYLLFYGQGANRWLYDATQDRFNRQINIYDTRNYYYIKVGGSPGLRVGEAPSLGAAAYETTSFDDVQHFEEDRINPFFATNKTPGGQRWYGDFFKIGREKTYPRLFNFPNLITSEPARLRAVMSIRTDRASPFQLTIEGQTRVSSLPNPVSVDGGVGEITGPVSTSALIDAQLNLSNPQVDVDLRFVQPSGARVSEGWLDYIQLWARRSLVWPGSGQLAFRDTRTLGQPTVGFALAGADEQVWVWDVTDPLRPVRRLAAPAAGGMRFAVSVDNQLREFVAFRATDGNLPAPTAIGRVPNQNLHAINAADMLIIYHPSLRDAAEQLAEHRRSYSGLRVVAVDVTHIYHEFSSGRVDPTALRDFARMVYDRDPNLRYLLLFGDGSFDSRGIYSSLIPSLVPVYENDASTELNAYAGEDYFGIFAGEPGANPLAYDLALSVGRLPVNNAADALAATQKIIRYDLEPATLSDWRTRLLFLGDDEDNGVHSRDANQVAVTSAQMAPFLNQEKLYFDLFPQENTPAGDRYPAVSEGIDRAVFRGVLAATYLGHGGPRGWAQERVLSIPQIQNWDNRDKLPLVITATCTFAAFDDASFVSAGEEAFLNPRGGAIALLTTTRPVYASENLLLTNATLRTLLTRLPDGSWPTLGDVVRDIKNNLTNPGAFNDERKFVLLGDPAMRLALPQYRVETLRINDRPVTEGQFDTIRALQQVTIEGQVTDLNGNLLSNFNGIVYPTVFDKAQQVTTLQQDPTSPAQTVSVQRNVLFKGRATVSNGQFRFSFVTPKDINYDFGPGRVSYYAADVDQHIDAAGIYEGVVIGGAGDGLVDNQGPLVEVFMNTPDFVFGSIVDPDPVLLVKLADDNGINVAGNSIGHDLEAVLDGDVRNTLLLNDFYEADVDDYTRGQARFPLARLAPGRHTIQVRAWDVANNSTEGNTEFVIATDGRVALEHVLNYPNPFTTHTCFQFDHNLAGEDLEVLVHIYTVSGRLVKTLEAFLPVSDGALRLDDCIEWDGRDDFGDALARGVYLYQVRVRTAGGTGLSGESDFEKLVILK